MKKILYIISVACMVLALYSCPVSALDVVDSLDGVLVVVNDGRPVPAYDGIVSADQLSSADTLSVSTIDFYIPFEAPSNTVVLRLSLLCSTANMSITGDVQAGAYSGGVFYPHYTLPYSQWDYGYSLVDGVALTNTGYSVDTSSVPASDFAWFVHFRLSGDAILVLSQGNITGSSVGNIESSIANGGGTFASSAGSFGADLYGTDTSTPLWQYYDSYNTIYWRSAGARYAYLKSNSLSVSGGLTLTGRIDGVVRSTFANTSFADYPPIRLTATRTDDDAEAVAQLQQINTTLDGMATNLQTITDDFTAREDVGNDISGVTSDGQISSGNSGMSTGSVSISDGISGLPSFSSIISPTSGFIGFLTVPIQQIFSFGNGYLLYIATAMVLLSVIFWIIKRMGGDDA